MKKIIQICIYTVVCLAIAASAGSMMTPHTSDTQQTAQVQPVQTKLSGISDLDGMNLPVPDRRPVEPAVLFLFGVGIIGIVCVHRLKFQ
jgi:hypothetical protein